jgi:hypothetical protein
MSASLRWARTHAATLLIVLALVVTDVIVVSDRQQLSQLEVATAVVQAFDQQQAQTTHQQQVASQQQAAIINAFFVEFLNEQNYLCRIASARAIASGLEPPPPGVCNVTLGPRAPPMPSPSP